MSEDIYHNKNPPWECFPWRISFLRTYLLNLFFFLVLVFLGEVHIGFPVGYGLEEQSLCTSVGHEVPFRIPLKVTEIHARSPVHVYRLDVVKRVELIGSHGAFAVQTNLERAHIP